MVANKRNVTRKLKTYTHRYGKILIEAKMWPIKKNEAPHILAKSYLSIVTVKCIVTVLLLTSNPLLQPCLFLCCSTTPKNPLTFWQVTLSKHSKEF